ncbi:hypothetical protein YC2023_062667 [Brassica napus]
MWKHEVDRPSTRCLRACNRSMLIDKFVLVWLLVCTPGMHPDMWEKWWRPACVLDMQPDMWSTRCRRTCVRSHAKRHTGCHQPEADWLVSPINTPRPQIISSHPDLPLSSFDDQVEMLSGVISDPWACQFLHGEAEVVSKTRSVQSTPVKTFILGFGHVLSDQQAPSRLEHCRSPGCDVDTTGPMPYRLDYEDNCVECVLCRQQVRNPPMLGMFWGGLVFPRPRTERVQGNPLFAGSVTRRTVDCRAVTQRTVGRGRLKVPSSGLCGSDIKIACEGWWILKLCGSRYLEVGLWQEAKSNLVTVALGTGCKALCLDAAGRVSGGTGRGRGVNFVTLTGSFLTRHVALPDHGVGLDGHLCSCLIVGWPIGLSSPTLGVGRPSVMFLFDCWPVGRPMLRTVRGCYRGGIRAWLLVSTVRLLVSIARLFGMKTLKWREFEAKPKPEAKEERQIQRTGLWYGLDRWGETRLRWEWTSSVFGEREIEKDLRNLDKFVSWEIRVLWQSNRRELRRTGTKHDGNQARWDQSTTGIKHDGIKARRENPKLGENPNFEHQNGSRKIFGIDHGLEICRKGQKSRKPTKKLVYMQPDMWKHEVDRPSTRCVRACNRCMLIDMCVLMWLLACTPGMHPDMWESGGVLHVSWTCSLTCGARGAAAHASGGMRSDPRAATNLKLIGWPLSSFDDQVEMLSEVISDPRAYQFLHGEAEVVSKTRSVQSTPVKTFILGFGHVLSDQQAPSRLEHCRSPGCDVDTTGPMPYRLDYESFLGIIESSVCYADSSGFKETPYSLDREDSDERGHVLWLSITQQCNMAVTRRTVDCRAVLTLSPKSGLDTGLGLVCICYAVSLVGRSCSCLIVGRLAHDTCSRYLGVGLWQEAKSNLVALGKPGPSGEACPGEARPGEAEACPGEWRVPGASRGVASRAQWPPGASRGVASRGVSGPGERGEVCTGRGEVHRGRGARVERCTGGGAPGRGATPERGGEARGEEESAGRKEPGERWPARGRAARGEVQGRGRPERGGEVRGGERCTGRGARGEMHGEVPGERGSLPSRGERPERERGRRGERERPESREGREAYYKFTGSSRGIGRAIAINLAELGARVVVNYTTKSSDAELVPAEINGLPAITGNGPRAIVVQANVSEPSQVNRFSTRRRRPSSRRFIFWLTRLDVNTKGAFLCSKEAANRIKQGGGGRIILLTSSMTRGLKPGFGAYAASKAAVETMVKILAKELKGTGITANCVAPGPIATEMFYEGKSSEVVEKIAAENPFGRVGEVKDVVPLVGFLACDGGEWINGQIIPVNAVCRCAVPFASSVTEAITGLLSSAAKLVSTICAIFHASASWQASCRVRKRT